MRTFSTILTLLFIAPFGLFAQTGPGGVGSTNGSSNLILWMNANNIAGSNGSTITSWADASGYNHNFTSGNGATLSKPAQNGNAALTFNGTSDYFERAYTAALSPTNFTIFSACNVTSNASYKAIYSNRDNDVILGNTAGFILYAGPAIDDWSFWTGSTGNPWDQIFSGVSTAGNWASQMISFDNSSGTKELSMQRGTVYTNTGVTVTPNGAQPMRIGAGNNEAAPDFYFEGSIGEIIMYNTVLNAAQKIIVENYLSAKYNYTLNSEDLYVQDDNANGDYDYDVAGIGRIDASNQHTDSKGNGIVRILNATGLDNDEFLLWGHDNGVQQAVNNSDVPAGVASRFARVWRVNEVNTAGSPVDVGDIDMQWDLSGFGAVTTSDLRLLIDTDNDGFFADETPIAGAVSLGGGIYAFNGVSAIANNLRFTLATTNLLQTPLPVTLTMFNAVPVNKNNVLVTWQTSTQFNNALFTVQRSKDNINWEDVKTIAGAGNSNDILNYAVTDETPYNGISFYRLKQTDINNVYSYSVIKTVNLNKTGKFNVNVYPNPVVQILTIKADEDELQRVSIYNMQGQDLSKLVTMQKISAAQVNIDVSNLKPGMYILKTNSTVQKITKQ